MLSSSISRVIRSGPSHSLSTVITLRASANPIVAASPIPILCRTHPRRHSSSKPSSPANGSSRGLVGPGDAPAKDAAPASKQENEKRPTARLGRRKSRDAATETVGKAKDDATLNLPSVPSTQHLHPHDIQVASFFSIHRPISVTASVPPNSTPSAFSNIFTPRPKSRVQPADVIYTLSSAVNMLESRGSKQTHTQSDQTQEEIELRAAVTQASVSNAEPETRHLDGAPGNELGMSLQQLTDRFRPFMPPPTPVPMGSLEAEAREQDLAEQRRAERTKTQKKSYTTVLTILESTHPNGQKTYEARTSPIVEDSPDPSATARHAPSSTPTSFLERMRIRQEKWEDFRDERARTMEAISVKRQRKLKMKKHKYKKLMKRTRNLRRRLDRN